MDRRSPFPSHGSSSPFGSRRNTVGPGTGSRVNQFDNDPRLDQMREQFDRERDTFFENPGMRWNEGGGGGGDRGAQGMENDDDFFRRGAFDSFPSAFPPSRFNDAFGSPRQHDQRFQQHSSSPPPPPPQRPSTASADRSESIPIRVVHMGKKHPASAGSPRNTTQLPARGSPQPEHSPRLERSHSEPPKAFNQRLFAGQQRPNAPTIPESGTPPPQSSSMQNPGLKVPEASNHHNLSKTASAPSVPSASPSSASQKPVPPPRRPSPTKSNLLQEDASQVRHIPIFVEGRNDPVYSRRLSEDQPQFSKKPSDFYPAGTAKMQPVRQQQARPSELPVKNVKKEMNNGESTSPIPMGCSGYKEPTTPMGVPEGTVIPLPWSPDFYNVGNRKEQDDSVEAQKRPEPPVPVKEPEPAKKPDPVKKPEPDMAKPNVASDESDCSGKATSEAASQPQRKLSKEELVMTKIEKVKEEVAELSKRIENFKGDKKDKEYRYLDEMLTRHLVSLDCVETYGDEDLRKIRKDSIRSINRCLSMLDSRAKGQLKKEAEENNSVLTALAEKSKMEADDGEQKKE
jgi:hypothetical protein